MIRIVELLTVWWLCTTLRPDYQEQQLAAHEHLVLAGINAIDAYMILALAVWKAPTAYRHSLNSNSWELDYLFVSYLTIQSLLTSSSSRPALTMPLRSTYGN